MKKKKSNERSLLILSIINTVIGVFTIALTVLLCIVDLGTEAIIFIICSLAIIACDVFIWREYARAVKARKRGNNYRGY